MKKKTKKNKNKLKYAEKLIRSYFNNKYKNKIKKIKSKKKIY